MADAKLTSLTAKQSSGLDLLYLVGSTGGDFKVTRDDVHPGIDDDSTAVAVTIDANRKMIVGSSTAVSLAGSAASNLHVVSANPGVHVARFGTAAAAGAAVRLGRSRNTAVGTPGTIVQSGDQVGEVRWLADDGTDLDAPAARITVTVNATPASNIIPGKLAIETATTAGVLTEALTADHNQNVTVGKGQLADAATDGFAYIPTTTSAAPSGTPTSKTGFAPMVFDDTNGALYIFYNSSWVSVALT